MDEKVKKIPVGSWAQCKNNETKRFVTRHTGEETFEDDGKVSGVEPSPSCYFKHYSEVVSPGFHCTECNGISPTSTVCENPSCPNMPCCGNPKSECKCRIISQPRLTVFLTKNPASSPPDTDRTVLFSNGSQVMSGFYGHHSFARAAGPKGFVQDIIHNDTQGSDDYEENVIWWMELPDPK